MFTPYKSPVFVCLPVCRMGYESERFVGYVNEGLLCCVCRDVLEDPVQAPCEHAFCRTCIHAWLGNHRNCPEDRLPLSSANLRPLHRYMYKSTENMPSVMANMGSAMTRPRNHIFSTTRRCKSVPPPFLCMIHTVCIWFGISTMDLKLNNDLEVHIIDFKSGIRVNKLEIH